MLRLEKEDTGHSTIPSKAIEEYEKKLKGRGVRLHGYLMLSGKKIVAEKYFAPYEKDSLHRMYSVTKSFVALAVGLLIKNGYVRLEDKICDYFPEKLPQGGAHPWCEEMTIKDMLCMQTCHSSTTYKRYEGNDWTESFFYVEPDHVPGTVFSYDTSSAHVLGALVEKLTGMKMLDYMRTEMLNELGFSKEAYIIEDPVGVSQGGSGMMCTLRDVAVVAYLCNQYGVLDGKELLPVSFMQEATSNQVPTDLQPKLDEQFGYGYFIWMPREEGFTFFGMGGQLAVCFPQYDFCYLTMADVNGNPAGVQILHDCFYDIIFPCLENKRVIEDICSTAKNSFQKKKALQSYHFYPNQMNWDKVTFDWKQELLSFTIPSGTFVLRFKLDDKNEMVSVPQTFLNTDYCCECQGYWNQGHFILKCFLTDEEQGNVQMDFAWKDRYLSVRVVSTSDPFMKDSKLQKCFQGFASAEEV